MSILDKIPSLAENELFQKLAAIEDITALCKEDQEKQDDAIKVMRDHIAAYKGAIIEAKIEVAKNMLMENEPIDKIARYTGLSEEELLRIKAQCSYTQGVTLGQELLGLQPVPEPHAELELGTNNLKSSTGC